MLYKRGNIFHYDFAVAGTRYRGSTNKTLLSEARRIESVLMAEAEERGAIALRHKAPLLRDFAGRFTEWLENAELAHKTKQYYRDGLRLLRDTRLAGMKLSDITNDEVIAVQWRSSATANTARSTISRMLTKAHEWKLVKDKVSISRARVGSRDLIFTPAQIRAVLAVAPSPLRDVFLIMIETGARPSEALRMRWEHVRWDDGVIFNPAGKTKLARRLLPLTEAVRELLEGRKEIAGAIFSASLDAIERQWQKTRALAQLPDKAVLYTARHTAITQMAMHTNNIPAVMRVAGHGSVQTNMIYQHPDVALVREAMNRANVTKTSQAVN